MTGTSKWTFATKGEHRFTATHLHGALPVSEAMPDPFDGFLSSPAISDGAVYFGSSDGNVYALDAATGALRWKFQTGDVVHASPTVADGRVFVGSWDGNCYALDAATGALAWKLEAGRDAQIHNQQGFQASALVTGGRVLVGCRDSIFYALDAKTGAKLWTMSNHGSWVVGSATARGEVIYFATSDSGKLYGVDAKTGAKRLELDFHTWPMFSSPAIAGSMLYIGSNRGTLDAIDLDAKRVAWSFVTDGAKLNAKAFTKPDGSPNYDAAFAGSFYDELVAGVAKLAALGQIQSSPAIGDRVIYVGSTDGNVYAID
ncbi:MAG TPA: PQQ-binding-like beta-propeller repeat protein [Kofleriaceae bacterium]|nr:PQQ-binding-like beta-propeller repeat protein [Kofleriaceae bacterium]